MNQLKKLMLFRLLILVIQLKSDYNIKKDEVEMKIPDHNKYIITPEFNKLTTENLGGRLK